MKFYLLILCFVASSCANMTPEQKARFATLFKPATPEESAKWDRIHRGIARVPEESSKKKKIECRSQNIGGITQTNCEEK